jgi:hypothetical protein
MMRNRSLLILALAFVVLITLFLVQRASQRRAAMQSPDEAVLAQTFDQDELSRIEIGYGSDSTAVVLERLPDGWVVRTAYSHPASQQRVDALLGSLADLSGEFRSENAAVLPDYGFTDSTVVTLTGYGKQDDQPLFALEVGKRPERGVGSFVKRPGSSAVYLSRANLLSNLGLYSGSGVPQSRHFLDLEAQKAERLDVDRIRLTADGHTIALEKEFTAPEKAADDTTGAEPQVDRKTYEWQMTAPETHAVLKTKADAILNSVCTVRAVDVVDPDGDLAAYGLADPERQVQIDMQDGSTVTLSFGQKREADGDQPAGVYMQVAGKPTVWVVSEYLVNNIFKNKEDLLPEKS